MTVTYTQLERAIGDMQQQVDILVRGFNVFRPYVNKPFERIYADMATKQDMYRLDAHLAGVDSRLDAVDGHLLGIDVGLVDVDGRLVGVETRLGEMGAQLSTIINILNIDSKRKPTASA